MCDRCQSEGLWVISYVDENNLRRAALPRSLLKGKLWDSVLSRYFRSAILAPKTCNSYPPSLNRLTHAVTLLTYYLVLTLNHILELRALDELKIECSGKMETENWIVMEVAEEIHPRFLSNSTLLSVRFCGTIIVFTAKKQISGGVAFISQCKTCFWLRIFWDPKAVIKSPSWHETVFVIRMFLIIQKLFFGGKLRSLTALTLIFHIHKGERNLRMLCYV